MSTAIAPPHLAALANLPDDAVVGVGTVARLYSCSKRHAWRAANAGLITAPLRVGCIVRWRIGSIREKRKRRKRKKGHSSFPKDDEWPPLAPTTIVVNGLSIYPQGDSNPCLSRERATMY
jgi:hypothetical protein